MGNLMNLKRKAQRQQSGFTLLEAMISIVVLSVGVLGLAAVYGQGLQFATIAQYDYIAEKKAEQAVEAIFTSRDIKSLSWVNIQNTTSGGVFLVGPQKVLVPGTDGLVGTQTDAAAADDVVITGPGQTLDLNPWMTRTITITTVPTANGGVEANLRQITVTMNYQIGNKTRTYTLISYISSFA
jgi:type IV pilus modification protein PilV